MFTQCPSCETTFQVTAEQLKIANGDVRCGECLTIFNALDNLSDAVPHKTEQSDIDPGTESSSPEQSDELSVSSDQTTNETSSSIDQNLEEFFGDLFEDSPDETYDEPVKLATTGPAKESAAKPNSGFFYGANEATIDKILHADETKPVEETDLKADESASEISSDPSSDLSPETSSGAEDKPKEKQEEEKLPVEAVDSKEVTDLSHVPDVILDELQAAKAQHLRAPKTPWVIGNILLMLAFALQATYFSRDTLAQNPAYRPYLNKACEVLKCEINIAYDTRLIEILGRDVRSHPTSKNALIAGTTLINNAAYAQPYPLLTLTFSDINGNLMSRRRFTPREYLRTGTDLEAGMPPEVPIQVELHLVDPGKAAVNFEFIAEVDPRS